MNMHAIAVVVLGGRLDFAPMASQLLGVSLQARHDTTQVMLGVSLRARCTRGSTSGPIMTKFGTHHYVDRSGNGSNLKE